MVGSRLRVKDSNRPDMCAMCHAPRLRSLLAKGAVSETDDYVAPTLRPPRRQATSQALNEAMSIGWRKRTPMRSPSTHITSPLRGDRPSIVTTTGS